MEFPPGFPSIFLPTEFPVKISPTKLHELYKRVLFQQDSLERYPQHRYPQQVSLNYLSKIDITSPSYLCLTISLAEFPTIASRKDAIFRGTHHTLAENDSNKVTTKIYLFQREEREYIDKTYERKIKWSSKPNLGSGVDYTRGRY